MKKILIIAGEASGDLHGASLMSFIKKDIPDAEFKGIGGSKMISEGLEHIRHINQMNFMGFAEVIKHLPFIYRTFSDIEKIADSWKPNVAILIDYPGFNLKLAPILKKRKIPVVYYISPQLWAWHKNRVYIVRDYVDKMVVLFEFEKEFYKQYGINAEFVGHPLLDIAKPVMNKDDFRKSIGADEETSVIGFMPGSRKQEIDRIFPQMIEGFKILKEKNRKTIGLVALAPDIDDRIFKKYLKNDDLICISGKTYDIMSHSDINIVTSGTATLEAGILGVPMIIVYKTSFLTYFIGSLLVSIKNIGMINIVAGKRVVPELWQDAVHAQTIASMTDVILRNETMRENIKIELEKVKKKLGKPGASERAAKIVLNLLEKSKN